MTSAPRWLTVGRIVAAFGTRGEVRVLPETDFPQRFAPGSRLFVEGDDRGLQVQSSRRQRGQYVLKLEGIDDRSRADDVAGRWLRVPGNDLAPLAEGEYYLFQVLGLAVRTEQGQAIGSVTDILPTGANDVYVVKGDRGEVLLPAIPDVIRQVDLAAGTMTVHLLPGLLE
ncbi:MAG: 16S rRNA processing protein RimM [Chloroflexota bacterium]|nr:16S rRNA processing protein RimM [Chloroflexota bacterium]